MKFGRNDKTPTISQSREGGQKNTATLGTDYRFLGRLRREKPEPNHTLYEEREREREQKASKSLEHETPINDTYEKYHTLSMRIEREKNGHAGNDGS